jgi:hypothetical protein
MTKAWNHPVNSAGKTSDSPAAGNRLNPFKKALIVHQEVEQAVHRLTLQAMVDRIHAGTVAVIVPVKTSPLDS